MSEGNNTPNNANPPNPPPGSGQTGGDTVPVRDLMALKEGHKKEVEKLQTDLTGVQTQLAEANRLSEERTNSLQQELLQVTAAKEQLEEQLKTSSTNQQNTEELQTKLTDTEKRNTELHTQLIDLKKAQIIAEHKVSPETLKGRDTMEQLETLEAALKELGAPTGANTYDGTGGAGLGGGMNLRAAIDAAKSKA